MASGLRERSFHEREHGKPAGEDCRGRTSVVLCTVSVRLLRCHSDMLLAGVKGGMRQDSVWVREDMSGSCTEST